MKRIYLDYAATAPLDPIAKVQMQRWLGDSFGNPSSLHAEGREARAAIDSARETISMTLGALFAEVLFTGSGTEAANMAILGAALNNEDPKRNVILLGAAEHHAVLHTEPILRRLGYDVQFIPVDGEAKVHPDALKPNENTLLVSVMHANNELGTINPIRDLAEKAKANGALFHTDAVQSYLAMPPFKAEDLGVDLLTLSAHKIGGPKGVGAIWTRAGVKLKPLINGGGQEREMRAGTENVAGIVGFAAAVASRISQPDSRQAEARDLFLANLIANGFTRTVRKETETLSGHAHVRLPGVDAETMLIKLDREGISASSGAACSSGSLEPSHVLLAAGYSNQESKEGLRFTFGRNATLEEGKRAAEIVVSAARALLQQRN